MFTRILVPLDGTPQSNAALVSTRTLAQLTNASVSLLYVIPRPRLPDEAATIDTATADLRRVGDELAGGTLEVDVNVRHGHVGEEIVREIAAKGIDLVVMRTHGRAGVGRAVLGSVAEQVLTHAQVPILLVRPGGRRMSKLRTLLVPVDGSPGGAIALATAVGMAKSSGARIKLLQVVVPIPTYIYGDPLPGAALYIDPAWDEEALVSARSYGAGLASRVAEGGVTVDSEVHLSPFVSRAIVDHAEAMAADMIVMSTHALTGPVRALVGSVADDVMRHAQCPVLLVHRPTPEPPETTVVETEAAPTPA